MAKFYAFHFLILTQQLLWLLVLHENNNSCIVVSGFSTKPSSPTASSDASPPSIIHDNNDNNNRKNVNFIDWISDAPEEVKGWKPLQVEEDGGKIPSYVQGTLIRNGGGIWTDDTKNKEMFSHIFDGLAKIHAYRITQTDNGRPPTVEYQARFLQGSWFRSFLASRTLPFGIGTGPVLDSQSKEPKTGYWRTVQAVWNTVTKFDNTPVNIWDYQPNSSKQSKVITALTDAPSRTRFDFSTMDTISSSKINAFAKGSKGYELLCTAHPLYSQKETSSPDVVDTYNVAVELGLNGPQVNLIKESTHLDGSSKRIVVANVPSGDGIPYFHSFGLSKNYAVIVFQPLRLDIDPLTLIELGFLRSMQHVDQTRIVVVELDTGNVVLDQSIDEKIYFFHSISTAELQDNGDNMVSLRLCAYRKPDQLTGEHQFMRLEQAKKGLDWRSKIDKGGKFCDINCNLNSKTVQVEWKDEIQQGFELPITRYSRSYNGVDICPDSPSSEEQIHPRYVYSFGAYALGSPDYDNWGLFKFDLEENQIAGYCQQDSVYISEPVFVADPEGTREDDGVLLTHAYFGEERQTKLLVLDAATMNVMATVATGSRAPLDFHGAWLPSRS